MFYNPAHTQRECLHCAGFFSAHADSPREFCSERCSERHNQAEAVIAARQAVKAIPATNDTARRRARALFLLDSLVDEPTDEADAAVKDAELGFSHERARLDMCQAILERAARHISTELDPRFESAFRELLAIVRGEREPRGYIDPVLLLKRYAEHHEAHKAEPGTIDAEVSAYVRRFE